MKLSKKKENELYKAVSDAVFETRIKIERIGNIPPEVDRILYDLMIQAPRRALKAFNPNQEI